MANPFDQFDGVKTGGPLQITVRPETAAPNPFDQFDGVKVGVAEDVAKSIAGGAGRGVAGVLGLPGTLNQLSDIAARHTVGRIINAVKSGGEDWSATPEQPIVHNGALAPPSSHDIQSGIERVTGKFYEPETIPGQFANTTTEFAVGALAGPASRAESVGAAIYNALKNAGKYGVVPGAVSETAGQATKGTSLETPARIIGGLAGGAVSAIASRPGTTKRAILDQLPDGITPAHVEQAHNLIADAAQHGIALTWPEALSQVAGRPVMTSVLRHLEASPQTEERMSQFFGGRPAAVEQSARGQFDNVAPINGQPSFIGPDASQAAREVIANSPEGRILADTVERAGPRMSPGDAGAVIQPELQQVYRGRERMRAALADQDYTAARNAPATIPTNGGYRETNAQVTYLDRQGVPILLDDAERNAAKAKWLDDNSYQTRIGIVGERPTQFAQVDAKPVVSALDDALSVAKGGPREALEKARRALLTGGEVDSSVAGLHESRVAIGDLISTAKRNGENGTVTKLMKALDDLDSALESVPAYGQAKRNFAAASEPLAPFAEDRVPGRIIERDQYGKRNVMPPEQVPGAIERGGGTAARDFNQVATPAAREAFESHLTTQVLETARAQGAEVSADSIRKALRQNEDLLKEYPGVRDRLESVAVAREGLDRLSQLPVGKLAEKDLTTKKAVDALFPKNPLPNSEHEIADAVSSLAERNPRVARDLVRVQLETTFNNAAKELQTGANQAVGAKFRTAIVGNPQQAKNLEVAVKALPNGDQVWSGFQRYLDVLEATGTRQNVGSRTAYNAEFLKEASTSNMAGEAVKAVAKPQKAFQFLADKYERYKLGKDLNSLARILTDPGSADLFRQLAKVPEGVGSAQAIATRIALLTNSATSKAREQPSK